MENGSKYLTVPQAAKETGKTARAIWQDIYRGRIPYRRWGRKVLIPKTELEKFLAALPGVTAEAAIERVEE